MRGRGRGLWLYITNLQNTPKRRKKPARRKLVRGRGRAVGGGGWEVAEVAGRWRRMRFEGVQYKFTECSEKTEKPARRKLVRGRGRAVGEGRGMGWKWQRMSGKRRLSEPPAACRPPGAAPQNSSPTSKQGQAFAANSLWPCTVARGKRRRSRSTSASSAMRCEGVRVSFGEPSLASRPPM